MTSPSLVFQRTGGQGVNRGATALPGDLRFYVGPAHLDQHARVEDESDLETRMIESNTEFYARLLLRIRSTGETVPADEIVTRPGRADTR